VALVTQPELFITTWVSALCCLTMVQYRDGIREFWREFERRNRNDIQRHEHLGHGLPYEFNDYS
jgi:hypothetical protein